MALYALTVFLSAFLLFQIQPVIAKMILPWFGGSSAVWSTCMLFFQATLLGGYLYAHWLHQKLSPRRQAMLHSALLVVSLAVLPIVPDSSWKSSSTENPSWQILILLAATVGLPYFLLLTTSPLIQSWYARTHSGAAPYRLFALSNFASMLALLGYPVLVEPNMTTRLQGQTWSLGYVAFGICCAAAAWIASSKKTVRSEQTFADDAPPPAIGLRALWVLLAACASILLLAITTFLTQDVAAVPFLWILPLAVYLLSFIICFESPKLYYRKVFFVLLVPSLWIVAKMISGGEVFKVAATVAFATGSLFVFCMICHGELARLKPAAKYLTSFYLALSVGGVMGGLFVGLVAPNLFNWNYEFPIGLAMCALLAAYVLISENRVFLRTSNGRVASVVLAGCVIAFLFMLGSGVRKSVAGYRVVTRNFYSQLRVRERDEDDGLGPRRVLMHGIIDHGGQFLSQPYRMQPTSYFCPDTGIGRAMSQDGGTPRRIGIIGLGCGNLIAYGRAGDLIRLYEINPQVLELARSEFSYLNETPAKIETVLGDGRLSLEREPDQKFDILVMDAFSGDSVPVHLITEEAFVTYRRHLKKGGILAVNVSNKYLNLGPVMERVASRFGWKAQLFEFETDFFDSFCNSVSWVLLMEPSRYAEMPATLKEGAALEARQGFRLWTDDFSNMLQILK